MFVITIYFEDPKEDWYCQLLYPRKIKNFLTLLTYLLTYLLTKLYMTLCDFLNLDCLVIDVLATFRFD